MGRLWWLYALLSALFAALVTIFSKIGVQGIDSNLMTAIRTAVVLVMAWGMVFITGSQAGIADIGRRTWVFLVLSGICTGISWLCYFKALQMAPAAKVAPIDKLSVVFTMLLAFLILGEPADLKTVVGGVLITAGTFIMIL